MLSLRTAVRTPDSLLKPMLAALIAVPLLGGTVMAQTDPARITGTVSDTDGGVVPGAVITVVNERTGVARTTTCAAEGRYFVSGLIPSRYTVQAALPGFAPVERKGVQLLSGQEVTLDLSLGVASQSETVIVTDEAPLLDLGSASMGANVNEREVSELPLNRRQLSQLYLRAPGALNSVTGTFSDIRFSGPAVEQNIIRYDGVEGSALIDAALRDQLRRRCRARPPAPARCRRSRRSSMPSRAREPSFSRAPPPTPTSTSPSSRKARR